MKKFILCVAVAVACIDWTRIKGTVKAINLKASTVTLQMRDGDLITIPIDYQVKIMEKDETIRSLKDLSLDQKIILLKVPSDLPLEDTSGMALPEPSQRGGK